MRTAVVGVIGCSYFPTLLPPVRSAPGTLVTKWMRALRPRFSRLDVEDALLLEGANAIVRWHVTGALLVRVRGYGWCRSVGSMRVSLNTPHLELQFTAYGILGSNKQVFRRRVLPLRIDVEKPVTRPMTAFFQHVVPQFVADRSMRSLSAVPSIHLPQVLNVLPAMRKHGPHDVHIPDPDINHHHGIQGLLNA